MLLTTKQVAEQLNCGETFVLERARAGDIAGYRLKGDGKRSVWRFSQDAVDAYLRECQAKTDSPVVEVAKQHNRRKRTSPAPSLLMQEAAKLGIEIKF